MDRDYSTEISINKFELEKEWEGQQADRTIYWTKQSAIAQRELDEAKMEKEITEASLYRKYRQELEDNGKKFTDSMIDACVKEDPKYREAAERINVAKENATIMEAVKWEFVGRKTSLEKIQEGILSGIFADPRDSSQQRDMEIREEMTTRRRRQ